jgi:hypothetical protein
VMQAFPILVLGFSGASHPHLVVLESSACPVIPMPPYTTKPPLAPHTKKAHYCHPSQPKPPFTTPSAIVIKPVQNC